LSRSALVRLQHHAWARHSGKEKSGASDTSQITRGSDDARLPVLKKQLQTLGQVEGKTCSIDCRSANGDAERQPALAAEFVQRHVDLILSDGGTGAVSAARNATRANPIVFTGVGDPGGRAFSQASRVPAGT
jgi:ABC-type uncharacterized transport system substrate-binding protein